MSAKSTLTVGALLIGNSLSEISAAGAAAQATARTNLGMGTADTFECGALQVNGNISSTASLLTLGATPTITNSSGYLVLSAGSGNLYLDSSAGSDVYVRPSGITAATFDSSQRLILAGVLRLANAAVAGAVVPTHTVTLQDSTGTTYRVPCLV